MLFCTKFHGVAVGQDTVCSKDLRGNNNVAVVFRTTNFATQALVRTSQLRQLLTNHVSAFCCVIIANARIVSRKTPRGQKAVSFCKLARQLPRCHVVNQVPSVPRLVFSRVVFGASRHDSVDDLAVCFDWLLHSASGVLQLLPNMRELALRKGPCCACGRDVV